MWVGGNVRINSGMEHPSCIYVGSCRSSKCHWITAWQPGQNHKYYYRGTLTGRLFFRALMCSGSVPQHPPMICTPASTHSRA